VESECTLKFYTRWRWPRCWISAEIEIDALEGTMPGALRFSTKDDTQRADCEFVLTSWDGQFSERSQELAYQHGTSLTNLGYTLGILLGARNSGAGAYYQYSERGKWHPSNIDLRPTLWDWSGPVGVERAPDDLGDLANASLALQDSEALEMLSVATAIGNPVARYLCMWQALALHLRSDSPTDVDKALSEKLGVPLDCQGHHGPESRFAQYRNWLSHPKDREKGSYAALDNRAREISDDFARTVLRLIFADGDGSRTTG